MQQLREEVKRLTQENQELRERLTAAETTIKQLLELPGQNSHNSNWPSSRDKSRQKTKSLRSKTGRGQEGHEGHTLCFNPEPDIMKTHRPAQCEHCQAPLAEEIAASTVAKRQVLDLPSLRYITTEHQVETVLCPNCSAATSANFRLVSPIQSNPIRYASQAPGRLPAQRATHSL